MGALEIGPLAFAKSAKIADLPTKDITETLQLLVEGGDGRIALDPVTGNNKYGCGVIPDSSLLVFGSSTASTISESGFAAAEELYRRVSPSIGSKIQGRVYGRELNRIRGELIDLCGLSDLQGLEVVFAASGTDIHLIAAQLAGAEEARPPLAIMVDAAETGSGVGVALAGRHFSTRSSLGNRVDQNSYLSGGCPVQVVNVPVRDGDGMLRNPDDVDAKIMDLVTHAASSGRRVLLTLVDVSKTGMIVPSPACALAMRQQFPDRVKVLVDACQFRIAPDTLRAYLDQGFMVALTGSKFVTGPSFSGALLIPAKIAKKFQYRLFPRSLGDYSARAEWPRHWSTAWLLQDKANWGLLLRWEAALAELRAFRGVPETEVASFLQAFGDAVKNRLTNDPSFELLPVPEIDRKALVQGQSWDQIQTIFPFVLYRNGNKTRMPLNRDETAQVHKWLRENLRVSSDSRFAGLAPELASLRCQVGQPVACGSQQETPMSALRLCASARLVVEAMHGKSVSAIIENAMAILDKAAALVSLI